MGYQITTHTFKQNMMKKSPIGTLPAEEMIARMAKYWGQKVYMRCPKCEG